MWSRDLSILSGVGTVARIMDPYNLSVFDKQSLSLSLFEHERYGLPEFDVVPFYTIKDIPIGHYELILYFAEPPSLRRGDRIVDVIINGVTLVESLDVFTRVGSGVVFSLYYARIPVSAGRFELSFRRVVGNPKLNALELLQMDAGVPSEPLLRPIVPVRINCGSAIPFIDSDGREWRADRFFTETTQLFEVPKRTTAFDVRADLLPLFTYARSSIPDGLADPTFYNFTLPNAVYDLTVVFSEQTAINSTQRVFDVLFNDDIVFSDVDIVGQVGRDKALTLTVRGLAITNEWFRLGLQRTAGVATINAFALEPVLSSTTSTPLATPTLLRIDCGSHVPRVDGLGRVWSADRFFELDNTEKRVVNDLDVMSDPLNASVIYHTERIQMEATGALQTFYVLPATPGRYLLTLYFSAILYDVDKPRTFDVVVNNEVVVPSLDVLARTVHPFTALAVPITDVFPVDGHVELGFRAIDDLPTLSALELTPA